MIDRDDPNYGDEGYSANSLISECCGAPSLGEVQEDCYGHLTGICSECRDHASFKQEAEKE